MMVVVVVVMMVVVVVVVVMVVVVCLNVRQALHRRSKRLRNQARGPVEQGLPHRARGQHGEGELMLRPPKPPRCVGPRGQRP